VRGSRAFGEENSLPSLDFLFFLCLPAPLGSSLSQSVSLTCAVSPRLLARVPELKTYWCFGGVISWILNFMILESIFLGKGRGLVDSNFRFCSSKLMFSLKGACGQ
jgi:hypothetical protein